MQFHLDSLAGPVALSLSERVSLMRRIAGRLRADSARLAEIAHRESHLPLPRLTGEIERTAGQWEHLAAEAERGACFGAVIQPGDPARSPLPRPDLRRVGVPVGLVAVYGASNFPFAFSVAGGDTASAIAAGCSVVNKANPAHLETARAVHEILVAEGGDALFGLIEGGIPESQALAADPAVAAVGFTGSQAAGMALVAICRNRPQPIPCYAEMGSLNPVVICADALASRCASLVDGYVASLTLGVGQFCTNPGLVILPDNDAGQEFLTLATEKLAALPPQPMLTQSIAESAEKGFGQLSGQVWVAPSREGQGQTPGLVSYRLADVTEPFEEIFGPMGIAVLVPESDFAAGASQLIKMHQGQLTGTLHTDHPAEAETIFRTLEANVGRVLLNGWPTGVEVAAAMHHGGPWPASSDAHHTSVGAASIQRWLRPVCYQNVPNALLPAPLQDANPWGIERR